MKFPYVCFSILMLASTLQADVVVPAIFSDNAVLLKESQVPVWGMADPGEKVTVSIDGTTAEAKADADGQWRVNLNLKDKAQGPFVLEIEGKNKLAIKNVAIGEVWVCSGQSNMELALGHTLGAKEEIANSANPMLRHFVVDRVPSMTSRKKMSGSWVIADPLTSSAFTAVGYWFGRTLTQTLNTPVGLINATWGGTPLEVWQSAELIDANPHLKERKEELFELMRKAPAAKAAYSGEMTKWIEANQRQDQPVEDAASFATGSTDGWTKINLPGKVTGPGLPKTGVVWVRRQVEVPASAADKDATLDFVLPNSFESIYWNGKKVSEYSWDKYTGPGRLVTIPASEVKAGSANLAIRIFAPSVTAELTGPPDRIKLFDKSIGGDWLAKSEREYPDLSEAAAEAGPRMPKDPPGQFVPTCLFNGMIAPLIPYGIRGVIWYQGESNVERAFAYRKAFPEMIADWRNKWNQGDFSFYFCQLANYETKWKGAGDNPWAELREAQAKALELPNTGMAVLIDLGETRDIHPRDKKSVGERLADIALAQDYGKRIAFAGPAFESMKIVGSKAEIRFKNLEGGLVAHPLPAEELYSISPKATGPLYIPRPDSELQGFAICGKDRKWKWANAKIQSDTVVVFSEEVPNPVAVRYAWANNPTCNLYNKAGLPAAPFRTDDFQLTTFGKEF